MTANFVDRWDTQKNPSTWLHSSAQDKTLVPPLVSPTVQQSTINYQLSTRSTQVHHQSTINSFHPQPSPHITCCLYYRRKSLTLSGLTFDFCCRVAAKRR